MLLKSIDKIKCSFDMNLVDFTVCDLLFSSFVRK